MCARYKADETPTPGPQRRGRSGAYGQAAPKPRVQPARPAPEPLSPPEPDPAPEPPAPRPAPRVQPRPQQPSVERIPVEEPAEPWREPASPRPEPRNCTESAFGTPGPPRDFTRHSPPPGQGGAEISPWQEISRPPRKGMSVWKAVFFILFFPFRIIWFITRKLPSFILWPIRLLVSGLFVGGLALLVLAVIYGVKAERYDLTQIMLMPERSKALDRKGAVIGTLHGENRSIIKDIDTEVPRYFVDALVVQEDRSFWTHGGVDARGVGRAVQQVFRHGHATQGASTITMQLAKNTYHHNKRTFDAKLTEVALARRIEATYDKKTILTCYINRVFWGHTFLGLKQASYGYFSKQPRELTLGEAAMLAGIICNPNGFSPYRNPKRAKIQRDKVLNLLYDNGYITRSQFEEAIQEELVTVKPERRGIDNYALDLIRSEVDHILDMLEEQQQGIKEHIVYSGGLEVKTTLDLDLQDEVMHELDARLTEMLEKRKGYKHQTRAQYQAMVAALPPEEASRIPAPKYVQAACVMIDNATGALLAVVGGRDSTESPLNRAVQSRRQVGSIFKPIVYSTFFERGGSPQTMVSDDRIQPGEIAGAAKWRPGNADGRFTGMHPAGWGLLKSRNTMSVRVGNRAGLQNVANSALLAGFPRNAHIGPTIYLGTWEASPLEVAGAYTVFANGGVRPTPYIIESITDSEGHVLWRNPASMRRVFSQRTANQTSAILQEITKPGGTAGQMQKLGFTAPSGGKTGTTNAYKNAWFCGFTSDITAAVWVGFDRPVTIADKAYGGTVAMPLWVGAMQIAQKRGYPMGAIRTAPATGRRAALRLCRTSGQLAHAGCEQGGTAYTETLADFSKPRSVCTLHDEVAEDPEGSADEVAEDPDAQPDIDDVVAEDPDER